MLNYEMKQSVVVVDYGMGNLRSVSKALEYVGASVEVTKDAARVSEAERLVVPGVGAFGKAMENLDKAGLADGVKEFLDTNRPFLGICLGLQLLFESSEEDNCPGLGILRGTVKRFGKGLKVPHMGWNTIEQPRRTPLLSGIPDKSYMYFVHSFYVDPEDDSVNAGITDYGTTFTSAIQKGNMTGVQFHPEKSQDIGLAVLKNFVEMK